MINSINEVKIYEEKDKEVSIGVSSFIKIKSHWNRQEFVVLEIGKGVMVTVLARDLKNAIDNATNTK